jgi:hypothetical protein
MHERLRRQRPPCCKASEELENEMVETRILGKKKSNKRNNTGIRPERNQ